MRPFHLFAVGLLIGCQQVTTSEPQNAPPPSPEQRLAQAYCGGCHAVERYGSSSNPNAPPFAAIANQEGLTAETLSFWLRGAHNYPSEMDLLLEERDVERLVAYFISLRDPHYRRPTD